MRGAARDLRAWWSGTWAGSSTRASPVRTQSKRHRQHTLLWCYLPCGRGRTQDFQPRAAGRVTRGGCSFSPTSPRPGARPVIGKGQMLSDVTLPPQARREERSSLHSTGRGGEEGREGRTTTAPGRQTACSLLPWSLELPEGRRPKTGTKCCRLRAQQDRVSCSAHWDPLGMEYPRTHSKQGDGQSLHSQSPTKHSLHGADSHHLLGATLK